MEAAAKCRPKVLVTNDDGIDGPGLRALVRVLVATDLYDVRVIAPYSEMSASSHSVAWPRPVAVSQVEIEGATAYAVKGTTVDCASLGISNALFSDPPDMVISGINKGLNCGYHIVYSGTVAGAREAFLRGVPSLSISFDWVGGKSSVDDFKIGAQACIPIINALLTDMRNGTYHRGSFLNINLPADILHYKGYKVTKQGISTITVGWKVVSPTTHGGKDSSTTNMNVDSATVETMNKPSMPQEVFFNREATGYEICKEEDTDHAALQQGYISVTPLAALSNAEIGACAYYKDWMLRAVPGAL
ncbi:Survival protein SurE-like protein phosphatase/nucleotidase [Cinnamomum micranthum f. kanehirae]|uniref:Survival protein SurE-like protein phosphatase/nucleotidase n=1 Tax=Cinnamomum micranthum f. kanehirae TaxID=337451 RepID=A0A3S3PTN8_9MAGN|nr:Survival protein SurE-like protein phosphatase/nucleotidase [Cinnamomum micranthum f. kanehirae]